MKVRLLISEFLLMMNPYNIGSPIEFKLYRGFFIVSFANYCLCLNHFIKRYPFIGKYLIHYIGEIPIDSLCGRRDNICKKTPNREMKLVSNSYDDKEASMEDYREKLNNTVLSQLMDHRKLFLQLKSQIDDHKEVEDIQQKMTTLLKYLELEISLVMDQNTLINQVIDDYEELIVVLREKNFVISEILTRHENERSQLFHNILEPLTQIQYSLLLGIRSFDQKTLSASAKEYLDELIETIDIKLEQMKKKTFQLYPIWLQDLGTVEALKYYYNLLKEINEIHIDIKFQGKLKRYPHEIEIKLFRLLQHFIQIINSYSNLSQLILSFSESDDQIVVKIEADCWVDLRKSTEYLLFKKVVDSLVGVNLLESLEDERTLHIVISK